MKVRNVISLFGGIESARVALDRAGIGFDNYYSSEVDKYAIQVSQNNYPDIIQLGDIQNWREWDIDWASIDLILAGSPCQGFSFAGKQLAFNDPRSRLFFVFVDILNHVKSLNPNVKFLLENVRMKKEYIQVISNYLEVEPVIINSALVSAQNRIRLYWCNWAVTQPEDKGILLKDIIHENTGFIKQLPRGKNKGNFHYEKSPTLTSNSFEHNNFVCSQGWHDWWHKNKEYQEKKSYSQICNGKDKAITLTARMFKNWNGNYVVNINPSGRGMNGNVHSIQKTKSPTLTTNKGEGLKIGRAITENKIVYRKLTPIECERLQTLPDNFTAGISNSQRYKCLGNGWTVDVIAHILSSMNDVQYIPTQVNLFSGMEARA